MRKLIFTFMSLFMVSTAMADSYFYIDDMDVDGAYGQQVVIPVKASFGAYVNAFQVDITYPEGLTPVKVEMGADACQSYYNLDGIEDVATPFFTCNPEKTRIIAAFAGFGYWDPDGNGEYELYGAVKWAAGDYDEMILITVRVEEDFYGGTIVVQTEVGASDDARGATVKDTGDAEVIFTREAYITVIPVPMELTGQIIYEYDGYDVVRIYYSGEEPVNMEVVVNGECVYGGEPDFTYNLPEFGVYDFVVTAYCDCYNPMTYEFVIDLPQPVTPAPTYTIDDMDYTYVVTVEGEGDLHLYLFGEEVQNPYEIPRCYDDMVYEFTAMAEIPGWIQSECITFTVVVPALEKQQAEAPIIDLTMDDANVYVNIVWPESDGEYVFIGNDVYPRGEQDYEVNVEAYVTEGHTYFESEHAVMTIVVPALDISEPDGYLLTLADAAVLHGNSVVIPVSMTNRESVTAFQTDLYLPEGFELQDVTLSDRKADHQLMRNVREDGAVRILCYSPSLSAFSGNDGELMYITVKVPDNAAGDYELLLKKSLLTIASFNEVRCPDDAGTLTVRAYIPGDVNGDGVVTVTDVVVTAQYIIGLNPSPFVFDAADMNGDDDITVTDVVFIARLVLNPDLVDMMRAPALGVNNDAMSADGIQLPAGETRTVTIALDNEVDYTAFQLDMQLPEGLTATNFRLTNRAGSHTLIANMLEDGTQRVMCYSPLLNVIDGHEGALLTFDVTATGSVTGDINVDGIEMVSAACQTARLNGFSIQVNGDVTGVREMVENVRIYTDGQNIIVESPVAQRIVISDVAGRSYEVDVTEGRNVIPARTAGVAIVKAGNQTAKLMINN